MASPFVRGGYYRHYKGKFYRALELVRHSETLEELVYYETLYDTEYGRYWVRPRDLFLGEIEIDGQLVPRFSYVGQEPPTT